MSDTDALRAAIDLFHLPSQIRAVRTRPLPNGTKLLLRLAVGDTDAMREAEILSNRPQSAIRQAAIFFIEQILLDPDADEYRTLGLDHTATMSELRANMAPLLKWLHPDLNDDTQKSTMAQQVIQAWKQVNTSEKLRRYPTTLARISSNAKHTRMDRSTDEHVRKPQPIVGRSHKLHRILRSIAAAARNKFIHCKN